VELKGRLLLGEVGVAVPVLPALIVAIEDVAFANDVTIALIAQIGDGNTYP
jgi:glycolate oxidase